MLLSSCSSDKQALQAAPNKQLVQGRVASAKRTSWARVADFISPAPGSVWPQVPAGTTPLTVSSGSCLLYFGMKTSRR